MRRLSGRVVVATHNAGKLAEFRDLLAPLGLTLVSAGALGLPVPEEPAADFVGNARLKAEAACAATGLPAIADDSGLCVDALGGAPGVATADWAEGPGGRDFVRAMTRLWSELEAVAAPEPRLASFRCAVVLRWPEGQEIAVEGACAGRIVWPMRGRVGHGFDPVFVPEGELRTFAEMSEAEKNAISHRGRAIAALRALCST